MFLSSCCQWLFLAESSRWPEQNSGKLAWQMLYWRKVRTVEWSWPSVASARCHIAWCDDSDTLASMWPGPCMSVLPTCTWFGVEPAASAAGVVVAQCEYNCNIYNVLRHSCILQIFYYFMIKIFRLTCTALQPSTCTGHCSICLCGQLQHHTLLCSPPTNCHRNCLTVLQSPSFNTY